VSERMAERRLYLQSLAVLGGADLGGLRVQEVSLGARAWRATQDNDIEGNVATTGGGGKARENENEQEGKWHRQESQETRPIGTDNPQPPTKRQKCMCVRVRLTFLSMRLDA